MNTEQRKNENNNIKKYFFKLMSNVVFGRIILIQYLQIYLPNDNYIKKELFGIKSKLSKKAQKNLFVIEIKKNTDTYR